MNTFQLFYNIVVQFSNSLFIQNRNCELIKTPTHQEVYLKASPNRGSTMINGGDNWLENPRFKLVWRDADHMNDTETYIFYVDAPDGLGVKTSPKQRAFHILNSFLMKSGIGCLKYEAVDFMEEVK